MNELALFAGAGGGILGGKLLGWKTVCAVEFDPHARNVLVARQNDGCLEPFPIWDDVRTFDGKPWRGIVDVVSGGFPCQDISTAGNKAGITGTKSSLWFDMRRIIHEVRPRFAFVENSPALTFRGLGRVLGDLAEMGYNARWGVLGAYHAGINHKRERIWIVADCRPLRSTSLCGWADQIRRNMERHKQAESQVDRYLEELDRQGKWGQSLRNKSSMPPYLCRVDDELAAPVDRIARIGNGQVPAVVRLAWKVLTNEA